MSEWIGRVGRLRRTIYARMEQLSFRTGAATVAGVFAVAATAVLLTLIQGGHHAAPSRVQAGAAPSSFLEAPPFAAFSPSAPHPSTTSRAAAAPDVRYGPEPGKTPTATPQASPFAALPSPRRTFWMTPPGTRTTRPTPPGFAWPWPTPSPSRQWNQPGRDLPLR